MRLYTIGHSTRALDELVAALRSFGVDLLVDIRTIPRSRHTPQFNREALSRTLPERGIRYAHLKALGGLRKPRPDSPNTAWRNAGFRGFADYMDTAEFGAALEELRELVRGAGAAAIMCAEAVPWRCHRSLVADALTAQGETVLHIMAPGKAQPHALTPFARIQDGRVSYPGEAGSPRRVKDEAAQIRLPLKARDKAAADKRTPKAKKKTAGRSSSRT